MYIRTSIYAILIFAASSCTKQKTGSAPCKASVTCTSTGVGFFFEGYKPEELDTVILKTYKQDNTFGTLIAETVLTERDTFQFSPHQGYWYVPTKYLSSYYDYQLVIPSTNQTFSIHLVYSEKVVSIDCEQLQNYKCPAMSPATSVSGGSFEYVHPGSLFGTYIGLKR